MDWSYGLLVANALSFGAHVENSSFILAFVVPPIDPSLGVWLTGDLTNHNAKSAILSDKQSRQESRLTSRDLNLKIGVYWHLSAVERRYLLMFIHVYFLW